MPITLDWINTLAARVYTVLQRRCERSADANDVDYIYCATCSVLFFSFFVLEKNIHAVRGADRLALTHIPAPSAYIYSVNIADELFFTYTLYVRVCVKNP